MDQEEVTAGTVPLRQEQTDEPNAFIWLFLKSHFVDKCMADLSYSFQCLFLDNSVGEQNPLYFGPEIQKLSLICHHQNKLTSKRKEPESFTV
jgi:hypothetical protein